jgi:hypothetical protein
VQKKPYHTLQKTQVSGSHAQNGAIDFLGRKGVRLVLVGSVVWLKCGDPHAGVAAHVPCNVPLKKHFYFPPKTGFLNNRNF